MPDVYIRNVSDEVYGKLKKLAKERLYPSLNAYLVDRLTYVAESESLSDIEIFMLEKEKELIEKIEENTETMLRALDIIYAKKEF